MTEKPPEPPCWCGFDHQYMDIDQDGNPFDVRDFEEDDE